MHILARFAAAGLIGIAGLMVGFGVGDAWSRADARRHAAAQQDPSTWSQARLAHDIAGYSHDQLGSPLPFLVSPYPVADYVSAGNGCFEHQVDVAGEQFFVYAPRAPQVADLTVTLADAQQREIELVDVAKIALHTGGTGLQKYFHVTSRNHPYYVGQGAMRGDKLRIDWCTLRLPSGERYARANTRLFDLNCGDTILILPMKDGSLRFWQTDLDDLAGDVPQQFVTLGRRAEIKAFVSQPGALN